MAEGTDKDRYYPESVACSLLSVNASKKRISKRLCRQLNGAKMAQIACQSDHLAQQDTTSGALDHRRLLSVCFSAI
jgi:hypothetical protein